MNVYHGDELRGDVRRSDASSQAIAKIAFLTGMFEKLVAEAGLRRERIEQMLAEMAEERAASQPVAVPAVEASRKRAA